jgi:hypothetical protein
MRTLFVLIIITSVYGSAQAANVTTSNNSSSSLGSGNSGRGSPSVTSSNNSSRNLGTARTSRSPSLTAPNLSSSVLGNNTGRGSPSVTTSNNTSSRLGTSFGGGPTNAPLLPYGTPTTRKNYITPTAPTGTGAIPETNQNMGYWLKSDPNRPYYIEQTDLKSSLNNFGE